MNEVKKDFKAYGHMRSLYLSVQLYFPKSEDDDNLCIKVDDVDFNSTNPGVWTMTWITSNNQRIYILESVQTR